MAKFQPRTACQAVTEAKWRSQQHWLKQCENSAQHVVDGVHLCGTHFNMAFRRTATPVMVQLRQLNDADMVANA